MNSLPEKIIYNWLRQLQIPVSFNYLETKLCSHYDYPSLLSITDTLDAIGIDNTAMVVDKKKIEELPVPFLAYAYKNENFNIINETLEFQKALSQEEFKNWAGVIIAAEKPQFWYNEENDQCLQKEKKDKRTLHCSLTSLLLFSFLILTHNFSVVSSTLLVSSFTGLFIAVLIAMQEFGYRSTVADQLCSVGTNTDCDAVLKSKASRLLMDLKWFDAGIIYFSSQSLTLMVSLLSNAIIPVNGFFSIIAALALPFSFYSLYYQKKVIRKWCMLCLLTLGILWLQFGILTSSFFSKSFALLSAHAVLIVSFSFFLTTVLWLVVLRPVLVNISESKQKNFKLLRFKNDPEIFETMLKQQVNIDITPFDDDIQLGNPAAPLQIVVACNPYCPPCARAHKSLDNLLAQNNMGLTIRFAINADDREDDKTRAVEYILKCVIQKGKGYTGYRQQVIHDWYDIMNLEKFASVHVLPGETFTEKLLRQHDQWAKDAKVEATPTIFINGFKLPKQYQPGDLQLFIDIFNRRNYEENENLNKKSPEGPNSLFAQTR